MLHLYRQIQEASSYVCERWPHKPKAGMILGTGLGGLADAVTASTVINYEDIPHFPKSTAIGHRGRLICGELNGVPVAAMQGRFHAYEGYSAAQITLPVRVMRALGIELLVVSNAAGGINPNFRCGDVMVIADHINFMNVNPLIGINDDRLGPRFPDMSAPYDPALIERAIKIARQNEFVAHRGVYAALRGPNYETRAEYRFLRRIGADMVGMSTVPEVLAANHAGLRVFALSTVTNMCLPDFLGATTGEDVVKTAAAAADKVQAIIGGIISDLPPLVVEK
ncbi:MAG: purine-nucleoside phosphorylase [Pirellulales bacterium]